MKKRIFYKIQMYEVIQEKNSIPKFECKKRICNAIF